MCLCLILLIIVRLEVNYDFFSYSANLVTLWNVTTNLLMLDQDNEVEVLVLYWKNYEFWEILPSMNEMLTKFRFTNESLTICYMPIPDYRHSISNRYYSLKIQWLIFVLATSSVPLGWEIFASFVVSIFWLGQLLLKKRHITMRYTLRL